MHCLLPALGYARRFVAMANQGGVEEMCGGRACDNDADERARA